MIRNITSLINLHTAIWWVQFCHLCIASIPWGLFVLTGSWDILIISSHFLRMKLWVYLLESCFGYVSDFDLYGRTLLLSLFMEVIKISSNDYLPSS